MVKSEYERNCPTLGYNYKVDVNEGSLMAFRWTRQKTRKLGKASIPHATEVFKYWIDLSILQEKMS